jgi:hypothetical protein
MQGGLFEEFSFSIGCRLVVFVSAFGILQQMVGQITKQNFIAMHEALRLTR